MTKNDYDIIIIGAGPVGLSFARALAKTNCKIALIEKQPEKQIKNPSYDGREIALTHLSQKLMQNLDVWDNIPQDQIAIIQDAKVVNGKSPYSLDFYGFETSKEHLGFMVSNHLIRKGSYDAVKPYFKKNVTLLADTEVKALNTRHNEASVELADGTVLKTSMIVSADSRFSRTRQMMGISTDMLDFGRTCIVCKMSISGEHDDTALECFHYDRTLAILPLNNKEVSVVITLDSQESDDLLSMNAKEFAKDIEERAQNQFSKMKLTTDRISYPLTATYAKTFYKKRYAVIGDAAVGMHPVTAHGFNLGLQSAHTHCHKN